jgi:hypothetical protein
VGGGAGHVGGCLDQVADALEEGLVRRHVADRTRVRLVPGVELGLQAVALGQQGGVPGRQVAHEGVEAGPEGSRVDTGAGQHLVVDEGGQRGVDVQGMDGRAHGRSPVGQGAAGVEEDGVQGDGTNCIQQLSDD